MNENVTLHALISEIQKDHFLTQRSILVLKNIIIGILQMNMLTIMTNTSLVASLSEGTILYAQNALDFMSVGVHPNPHTCQ